MVNEETPITVQQSWDDWRCAEVRLGDLQDVHWFQPPGAPKAIVHGYISPAKVLSGDLSQNPDAAGGRLLVCVIRCHLAGEVYTALAARAAPPR